MFSFVFCPSFRAIHVATRRVHDLIRLVILVLPLHFPYCHTPSWTIIVLNLHKISLVLLLAPVRVLDLLRHSSRQLSPDADLDSVCSFFNHSRTSSSCSMLVLSLILHSLLCGMDLPGGTVFSDVRSVYVRSPHCRVQCGCGRARTFSAPRFVGLDWYLAGGCDGIPRMSNASSAHHL